MSKNLDILVLLAQLLAATNAQGKLSLFGCMDAWIHMKCPGDDKLAVFDIRVLHKKEGSYCLQRTPDYNQLIVPQTLVTACPNDKNCVYVEGICDGRNECAFYISPHYFDKSAHPKDNSEVLVVYECYAGPSRVAAAAVVGLLAFCAIAAGVIIIYIMLRRRTNASNYAEFENAPSRRDSTRSAAEAPGGSVAYSKSDDSLDMRPTV